MCTIHRRRCHFRLLSLTGCTMDDYLYSLAVKSIFVVVCYIYEFYYTSLMFCKKKQNLNKENRRSRFLVDCTS